MGGSGPPKCKTCGKAEWRHICGGLPETKLMDFVQRGIRAQKAVDAIIREIPAPAPKAPSKPRKPRQNKSEAVAAEKADDIPVVASTKAEKAAKPDRKEYLKLKARERRARQKAEKEG